MVVYSVLSTESDTQYVRVYGNYAPPENDPLLNPGEQHVSDAVVTISDGAMAFTFREVVLPRPERNRYEDDIHTFASHPFRPEHGKTYKLTVTSATHGLAGATAVVPGKGVLDVSYFYYLENPYLFPNLSPIVSVRLSPLTAAYLVRLIIEYEALGPNGRLVTKRAEVPVKLEVISCTHEIYNFVYPKVIRRTTQLNPRSDQREAFGFTNFAYRRSVELVNERNQSVRFLRAVFYLVQFEETWYRYYGIVNTVRDKYSIRLDDPDFTNITGGTGLFASFAVDSLEVPLPEVIRAERPDLWSNCK